MATPFTRYRDFFEASEVGEFTQLLKSHDIEFVTEDFDGIRRPGYGNSPTNNGTTVKLHHEDFAKVDALLNVHAASLLSTVDNEYPLFKFSNEELIEIVARPGQYSAFDYQAAKSILASRGAEASKTNGEMLRTQGKGSLLLFIVFIVLALAMILFLILNTEGTQI